MGASAWGVLKAAWHRPRTEGSFPVTARSTRSAVAVSAAESRRAHPRRIGIVTGRSSENTQTTPRGVISGKRDDAGGSRWVPAPRRRLGRSRGGARRGRVVCASLISPSDTWEIWSALLGCASFGHWANQTKVGNALSGEAPSESRHAPVVTRVYAPRLGANAQTRASARVDDRRRRSTARGLRPCARAQCARCCVARCWRTSGCFRLPAHTTRRFSRRWCRWPRRYSSSARTCA